MKVIDPAKAVEIYHVLTGVTEPTNEAQAQYVERIKRVFIPPSFRNQAKGYREVPRTYNKEPLNLDVRPVDDENSRRVEQVSLTHEGIEQGKSQALPTGDR